MDPPRYHATQKAVVQLCVQLQRDAFANSENARNMSIAGSLVEVLKILMCVVVVPLFAQIPLVSTVMLMETDAQMLQYQFVQRLLQLQAF